MKTTATIYSCDNPNPDCDTVLVVKDELMFGGCDPLAEWIVLGSGYYFCCIECYIVYKKREKSKPKNPHEFWDSQKLIKKMEGLKKCERISEK